MMDAQRRNVGRQALWAASLRQSWSELSGSSSAVTLLDGRVLFVSSDWSRIYDPLAATWTEVAPLATRSRFSTLTLMSNGRVLSAGGLDLAGDSVRTAEVFDPQTGTWALVPQLPFAAPIRHATEGRHTS